MQEVDGLFRALADPSRIRIIKLLGKNKMCVCELAFVLGVSGPAVSKHLKKMLVAGLLGVEQDGLWSNYFISPKSRYAQTLLRILHGWLKDDAIVKADLARMRKADRTKLCCRR